ncbi:hypothetical protein [Endozoicomonas sp. SCSIO W0465]|uniref:hypothetical protein n=1 Tax=Endozoicomonas sp. SCSIO W0465 TaxID=2918516 RepID=UPI0020750F4F|nr:hypothetical protein [Endozoicomonas sp. SCSIO W0465]USE34218.1 hypothetical protein MJO57_18850 [Endozoicomonas sp. SCSIO W0465]
MRIIYHQEPEQSEPLDLSDKTKAQQSDENILYTSQSGLRIDRVWSMAVKADARSHSINALRVDIKLKKGSFPAAEPTLNSHNKASKPLSMAEQDEYCK